MGIGSDAPSGHFGSVDGSSAPAGSGFPGFGGPPPAIASTNQIGSATTASHSDHTHEGVHSVDGLLGDVSFTSDSLLPLAASTGNVNFGQLIQANWAIATPRWYAIDGVNGNDANTGFSDVSSAAAGLVAKKTLPGLGAIFPRQGAGRKVIVRVAAGTYVGGLDVFMAGCVGYAGDFPLLLPTVTSSTAGCTAFDGSVADKIMAGFTTATGMNAGGYNPVSPFSQTALKCLTVASGSPGFPSETTAPVPMGIRIRFDAATTTAALRNFATNIVGISAADTLTLVNVVTGSGALPAIPAGTDVFYIEMPGFNCDATTLEVFNAGSGLLSHYYGPPQIVGVSAPSFAVKSCSVRMCGCVGSLTSILATVSAPPTFADETGTARTVGFGLRCVGQLTGTFSPIGFDFNDQNSNAVLTASASYSNSLAHNLSNGSFVAGGIAIANVHAEVSEDAAVGQPTSEIGARGANNQSPLRIRGTVATPLGGTASISIFGSEVTISRVDVQNAGASPCVKVIGKCSVSLSALNTGSTGNTDVGLDLVAAVGCTIVLTSAPTMTGASGDVRLSDGTIVSWASLVGFPLTDLKGNRFVSAGGNGQGAAVANGTTAVALGLFGPAGSSATPTRWAKIPDGVGGFFTVPSYT